MIDWHRMNLGVGSKRRGQLDWTARDSTGASKESAGGGRAGWQLRESVPRSRSGRGGMPSVPCSPPLEFLCCVRWKLGATVTATRFGAGGWRPTGERERREGRVRAGRPAGGGGDLGHPVA